MISRQESHFKYSIFYRFHLCSSILGIHRLPLFCHYLYLLGLHNQHHLKSLFFHRPHLLAVMSLHHNRFRLLSSRYSTTVPLMMIDNCPAFIKLSISAPEIDSGPALSTWIIFWMAVSVSRFSGEANSDFV